MPRKIRETLAPEENDGRRVQLFCGEGLTQQQFRDDTDVNLILKRHEATGDLIHLAPSEGRYGDFDTNLDYQTALNRVADAQRDFAALPAEVRFRMNNDPGELLAFMGDPENQDEAVKLGLVKAPIELVVPAVDPVPAAEPPAAGGVSPPVPSPKPEEKGGAE